MSTRITINVSGNRLLQQSREAQAANRQQLTQKEVDDKFVADVRQIEEAAPPQRDGAVPEYGIQEQTSAQRAGLYLAGGQIFYSPSLYLYDLGSFTIRTMKAAGGYPTYKKTPQVNTQGQYLQIEYIPEWVGQAGSNEENYVGDGSFFDYTEDPNIFSIVRFQNSTDSWADHIEFVLPAGEKNFIVVLKHTAMQVGYRNRYRQQATIINNITTYGDPVLEFEDNYQQTSSVKKAFIVSPSTVREIAVPSKLTDYLDQHLPDIVPNISSNDLEYPIYSGPYGISTTLLNKPWFDYDIYAETKKYYNVDPITRSFAQSFGIGVFRYDTTIGSGPAFHNSFQYYSPSVFPYLKGTLNLPTDQPLFNYAQMRTLLAGAPLPNYYLSTDDPLLDDYVPDSKTKAGFVPATAVADLNTLVDKALVREKIIDVQIRANDDMYQFGGFTYIWDWGKPQYCRTQLLSLGFTAADLTP